MNGMLQNVKQKVGIWWGILFISVVLLFAKVMLFLKNIFHSSTYLEKIKYHLDSLS